MAYQTAKNLFSKTLESIQADGLYKSERYICSPQAGEIDVKLTEEGPVNKVINLCSNNYLGLSSHPEILKAAHQGLEERGFGMSSVRFICGTQDIHRELEKKLASFLGMEDSILFASCFDANAALFEALLGPEDGIFSDQLVHASIIDGIRLCKAKRFIFKHSDMSDLEEKLKSSNCRLKLIITDGVFSMDGDMAKLDQITALAEKYDALVAMDDCHATGFIGKTGRGVHEHYQVMDKVDIITTTLGKALGGATGGCVAAKQEVVDLLKQRGRPYLFSNALMPAVVTASLKAIEILEQSTERRDHLEELTLHWRKGLTDLGFDLKQGNTPIIPIMLYDANLAQKFSQKLYEQGVFSVGFFYPVVPKGEARIRTQLSAALDRKMLDRGLEIFARVGKELGVLGLNREELIAKFSRTAE